MSGRRPLILVGGTGRSGTHVISRLLGRHPTLADVPIESRFHCHGPKGFPDLLGGRAEPADFLWKLREFWWHRVRKEDGEPRGLYTITSRRRFDRAVAAFEEAYPSDPEGACRRLFCDLLYPGADELGRPGLVEMSSHNVREAPVLERLFPEARFIHVFRDGRDVASSITTKTWGPDRIAGAIDWWAARMRAIDAGVRGDDGGSRIAADRFHPVLLDDLVERRREDSYERLRDFCGLDDAEPMRRYFEDEMSPRAANVGRWRRDLGSVGVWRIERRYRRTLDALEREGNHAAPALIAASYSGEEL
jgi:sulfotransferase family protein